MDAMEKEVGTEKKRKGQPIVVGRGVLALILIVALGVGAVGGALFGYFWASRQYFTPIANQSRDILIESYENGSHSEVILTSMMADKAEEICAGLSTDKEKALAVATWVVENIVTLQADYGLNNSLGHSPAAWFAARRGLCGAKSSITQEMLAFQGIPSRAVTMYNFPSASAGGHSCVEVFYDGGWHYFDVTYAGYFEVDGYILSLEEMLKDPQAAVAGMVVLNGKIDHVFDEYGMMTEVPIDYYERMRSNYSVESLANLRSYTTGNGVEETTLYTQVDAHNLPLAVGELNQNATDIPNDGLAKGLGYYLDMALASPAYSGGDWLSYEFEWENLIVDQTYAMEFSLLSAAQASVVFSAQSTGAEVTLGASYTTSQALAEGQPDAWRIEFTPQQERCSILITYEPADKERGALIDQIVFALAE